jgi:hypothetical protein
MIVQYILVLVNLEYKPKITTKRIKDNLIFNILLLNLNQTIWQVKQKMKNLQLII